MVYGLLNYDLEAGPQNIHNEGTRCPRGPSLLRLVADYSVTIKIVAEL